ncbi:VWA domain-containing protein [Puia sp. P3]|uniref:VWA domain-containing protein n=1 Tax=Puia sp. P3 TaxID=3423952 RepID=UPI003D66BE17
MRSALLLLLSILLSLAPRAQYYLRGEIKDQNNSLLPDVKILLHSSGYLYHSGSSGAFGIPIPQTSDTLTLSAEGFQTITLRVESSVYQTILMKANHNSAPSTAVPKKSLLSLTKDLRATDRKGWTVGAETYSSLVENDFIPATRFPETGFAVTIDKASYSNVRRFLNMGSTIPPDAVRIEELLNYFNFGYVDPPRDSCFCCIPIYRTAPGIRLISCCSCRYARGNWIRRGYRPRIWYSWSTFRGRWTCPISCRC